MIYFSGMSNIKETHTVEVEVYPRTYQSQEKFENLQDELNEKYGVTEFTLGRSTEDKKLVLKFKVEK